MLRAYRNVARGILYNAIVINDSEVSTEIAENRRHTPTRPHAPTHPRASAGSKTTISYQSFPPFWQSSHRVVNKVWATAFSITFMSWLIFTHRRSNFVSHPLARHAAAVCRQLQLTSECFAARPSPLILHHPYPYFSFASFSLCRGNFRHPSSFTRVPATSCCFTPAVTYVHII